MQPGGVQREREQKEMGMAVMGGCNSICERPVLQGTIRNEMK